MNASSTAAAGPVLPLVPTHEEMLQREAVAGIAADFGPAYIRARVEASEPPTELWEALASRGYLGVNIPEAYDGGGRGLTELAAVGEELAKAGCPLLLLLVSPAIAGSVLAWMASTMKDNGVIAAVGLAASPTLNTTVMPFILRGASLLGINSGESSKDIRDMVWQRLATDLKPPLLKEMCRTIPLAELPGVFDDFINAKVSRRVVVDLAE